jgi:hypothetical protein
MVTSCCRGSGKPGRTHTRTLRCPPLARRRVGIGQAPIPVLHTTPLFIHTASCNAGSKRQTIWSVILQKHKKNKLHLLDKGAV